MRTAPVSPSKGLSARTIAAVAGAVWVLVILGVGVNVASGPIGDWLLKDERASALRLAGVAIVLALLGGVTMIWVVKARRQERAEEFALCKDSRQLLPADLGYEEVERGTASSPRTRPYHSRYLARRARVDRASSRASISVGSVLAESELRSHVAAGHSLLFIGPPTDGKTRTALECLRSLEGVAVVMPHLSREPSAAAIADFAGRDVVLLVDDLHQWHSGVVDLYALWHRLTKVARTCPLVATTRPGEPLEAIRSGWGGLRRLYEAIDIEVRLERVDEQRKKEVAKEVGGQTEAASAGTLGAVFMADALHLMRMQLDRVDAISRDVIATLSLSPFTLMSPTHRRLLIALKVVKGRELDLGQLRQSLSQLHDLGFVLSRADDDPVVPEEAHLLTPLNEASSLTSLADHLVLARAYIAANDTEAASRVNQVFVLTTSDTGMTRQMLQEDALFCREFIAHFEQRGDVSAWFAGMFITLDGLLQGIDPEGSLDERARLMRRANRLLREHYGEADPEVFGLRVIVLHSECPVFPVA